MHYFGVLTYREVLANCKVNHRPYIIDLTHSVETKALAATRNEVCFPLIAEVVSTPPLLLCRVPALKKVSAHEILDKSVTA